DPTRAKALFARAKKLVPELDALKEFEENANDIDAAGGSARKKAQPVAQPVPEKTLETTPVKERRTEEHVAMGIPQVSTPEEAFDDKAAALIKAAEAAEGQGVEKGIDAWRKVVQAAPDKRRPRRELGRLYRRAERWNALIEVL